MADTPFEVGVPIHFDNMAKFTADLSSVASQLTSKLGGSLLSGLGILGVAVGIGATVTHAIKNAMGAEDKLHDMKDTLQATGQAVESNIQKFNNLASAIAATTTVSKGHVKELIEQGLKMGLTADQAARFSTTALGLAKATGTDASEAMNLLARGDDRALMALGRHSREVQQATTRQAKLAAINHLAAQGMEELKGATETSSGKWEKLENTIQGLYTKFGTLLLPIISKIIDGLSGLFDWISQTITANESMGDSTTKVASNIASCWSPVMDVWNAVVSGIKQGCEDLVFAFSNWNLIASNVGLSIAQTFVGLWDRISWFGQQVPILFGWVWDNAYNIFKDWANMEITVITNLAENFKRIWSGLLSWFHGNGFKLDLKPLTEGFKSEIKAMPQFTKFTTSDLYKELGKDIDRNTDELGKQYNKWEKGLVAAKPDKAKNDQTVNDSLGLDKGDLGKQKSSGGGFVGLADAWKKAQEGIMKSNDDKKAAEQRKQTADATMRTAKATEKMAQQKNYARAH